MSIFCKKASNLVLKVSTVHDDMFFKYRGKLLKSLGPFLTKLGVLSIFLLGQLNIRSFI